MTNKNIIENKISNVNKYLKKLESFKGYSKKAIMQDMIVEGALERYLYLAAQSAIDMAEVIIAYKKLRKPQTFSDAFSILREDKIISFDLSEKLTKMVGFRNIIAHDYEEVDINIVYDILHNRLSDIEEFINICSKVK